MNRLKPLDTIRGVAAIIVAFFSHYHHFDHAMAADAQPFYSFLGFFYENGWHMVDLFFVLSGVVFSYVYGRKIFQQRIDAREYSVYRFSRLYPLHLATLIFVSALFLYGIAKGIGIFVYTQSDTNYFLANVLFIQSGVTPWPWTFNGPAWSISCEIVAYIMFFVIMRYFFRMRVVISVGLIVIGFLFRHLHTGYFFVNMDIGRLFMGFFLGILIYEVLFYEKLKTWHFGLIVAGLLAGFAAVMYVKPSAWSYTYVVFLYPAFIIASIRFAPLNKLLSIRPLTYLGDISYSVYLLHFPVQLLIYSIAVAGGLHFPYTSPLFFLFYGGAVVAVSVVSYEYFEKPVQMILRKRLLAEKKISPKVTAPVQQEVV
ncbi:MAG: acyltransferase [Ignavibacteriae bacterium]|nr:acyltransferase [Ignavibacteriota bacterium]